LLISGVITTLRELMTPPNPPKRPIGFVIDDKATKKAENKGKKK